MNFHTTEPGRDFIELATDRILRKSCLPNDVMSLAWWVRKNSPLLFEARKLLAIVKKYQDDHNLGNHDYWDKRCLNPPHDRCSCPVCDDAAAAVGRIQDSAAALNPPSQVKMERAQHRDKESPADGAWMFCPDNQSPPPPPPILCCPPPPNRILRGGILGGQVETRESRLAQCYWDKLVTSWPALSDHERIVRSAVLEMLVLQARTSL